MDIRTIFTLIVLVVLIVMPFITLSAPPLSEKLKGKILLAVEDRGRTYYVHSDGNRYQITRDTALEIFKKLAIGVKNSDIEQIPLRNVGISPEINTQSCPAVTACISASTDCSLYIDQITSLMKENATLKNNGNAVLISTSTISNPTEDLKAKLSKEYGLKINKLESESLEIKSLLSATSNVTNVYNKRVGMYKYSTIYDKVLIQSWLPPELWNTNFKLNMIMATFVKLDDAHTNDISNDVKQYLQNQVLSRNSQIEVLNNELERKLLEL